MAKQPRSGVRYPAFQFRGQPLVVEKLRESDINMKSARAMSAVLLSAYAAQFERPNGRLPEGAVKQHLFDPDSTRRVRDQQGRMASHTAKFNSQYWFVRDPDAPADMVGLAKVSPPGFIKGVPMGYFNDVVVRAPDQHQGLGTALAHAALAHGPIPSTQRLMLDAIAGSPVNAWYENTWGLVQQEGAQSGVVGGQGLALPEVRYITAPDITVASIVHALEAYQPALVGGKLVEL